MNISRHAFLVCALLTGSGCSGSYKYVPLTTWPQADEILSREVTTAAGKFRCESGFEYEGPLEYRENQGKYHSIIPQPCRRVIARKQDLLVVTTDKPRGMETTLWSVDPGQRHNPTILQITHLHGVSCNFRRRTEGIEFELRSTRPETAQCILITSDNVIHSKQCAKKEPTVCFI